MDIGVEYIDRWHREQGYFKVGYHFVIKRDGTVEPGRKINSVGAHVLVRGQAYNQRSIGICLVGGRRSVPKGTSTNDPTLQEANYTAEQWTALRELLDTLHTRFPTARIVGHRDLTKDGRACPSFDVAEWLERGFTTDEHHDLTPPVGGACPAEPEADAESNPSGSKTPRRRRSGKRSK